MIKWLSECEARILAMALDSEGCITIRVAHQGRNLAPRISFSNTSLDLVKFVNDLTGNTDIHGNPRHIGNNSNNCKDTNKVGHLVCWDAKEEVIDILEQVRSYLIAKKRQAELVLEFCYIRQIKISKDHHAHLGVEEHEIAREVWNLNRKGKNKDENY